MQKDHNWTNKFLVQIIYILFKEILNTCKNKNNHGTGILEYV